MGTSLRNIKVHFNLANNWTWKIFIRCKKKAESSWQKYLSLVCTDSVPMPVRVLGNLALKLQQAVLAPPASSRQRWIAHAACPPSSRWSPRPNGFLTRLKDVVPPRLPSFTGGGGRPLRPREPGARRGSTRGSCPPSATPAAPARSAGAAWKRRRRGGRPEMTSLHGRLGSSGGRWCVGDFLFWLCQIGIHGRNWDKGYLKEM